MTALAANGNLDYRGPFILRQYPMGAAKKVWKGSKVVLDTTTGLAEAATDAANKKVVGVATKACDNSLGAAGALNCEVLVGEVKVEGSSLEQVDVGKLVYIIDDATVGDGTAASNDIPSGTMTEYISATECWENVLEGVAGLAST